MPMNSDYIVFFSIEESDNNHRIFLIAFGHCAFGEIKVNCPGLLYMWQPQSLHRLRL